MAKTERKRSSSAATAQVLERGDIYFAYRPKIEEQTARRPEDVARLYMILSPRDKRSYRLVIIGEKRLPPVNRGADRKIWGFVEKVAGRAEEVEDELDPETYRTKTHGKRRLPAARPAGEGVYALPRHGDHTHLAYAIELPSKPGEVQRALNIVEQGSYLIAVKNPEGPSTGGTGLDETRRAVFPKHLQERFHGHRFISVAAGVPGLYGRRNPAGRRQTERLRGARSGSQPGARDANDGGDL
jgi:hypothetical protein